MNAINTNEIQAIETAQWNDSAIQENFWRVDEICDFLSDNNLESDVEYLRVNAKYYDATIRKIGDMIYICDNDEYKIYSGFSTIEEFVREYAKTLGTIEEALFLESFGIKAIYEFDELELCNNYTAVDAYYNIVNDYNDVQGEMIQDLANGSDQYFCNGDQDVYVIDERLFEFKYIEI